jgi:hypothetical protein
MTAGGRRHVDHLYDGLRPIFAEGWTLRSAGKGWFAGSGTRQRMSLPGADKKHPAKNFALGKSSVSCSAGINHVIYKIMRSSDVTVHSLATEATRTTLPMSPIFF